MKISETSWKKFAIIEWIECRLTTKSRSKEAKDMKLNLWIYEIDTYWIYRKINWTPILIPSKIEKIKKIMKKMWYTEFDVDYHTHPLVKMFK